MAARRSTPGSRPFPHQNFTGGEIGREVSARSDLEIFSRSTESNLNAIPQPFGGIRRRPGTGFIDFTHPLLKSATTYGAHRIIPFKYSDTQSYIISFYDGFLRFHTDAALILDSSYVFAPNILNIFNVGGNQVWLEFTAVHGLVNDERIIIVGCDQTELNGREFLVFVLDTTTIAMSEVATGRFSGAQVTPGSTLNKAYDVAHTYSVSELEDIKYAQTGDTIILTHPSHPPRKLVRGSAHDDWTLSNVSFASSQERPFASSASDPEGSSGKGYEVQYAVTRVGYDGSESLPSFTDWEEEAAPENALGAASDPSMVGIHAETQMRMYPGGPLTGDTI